MKRLTSFIIIGCFWCGLLLTATASLAATVSPELREEVMGQLKAGASDTGKAGPTDPRLIVGYIIKICLGLLATIFIVLLLLSGYWLLIARGEEEKIKKAQDTARRAVIGLIIVMISYAIVHYIMRALSGIAVTGSGPMKYY